MMDGWSVLFGVFSLGSAGMLLWGLAVLVPVAIHLWSRRRFDQTPWAAMQFLAAAIEKNARRWRFEQWLLLLLRCLAILVLAMALADPAIMRPSDTHATGSVIAPRDVILVLDASYSMQYTVEGVRCFERACQVADQIVAAANRGDRFSLILLSDPPQVVIGCPVADRQQVRREIAELETTEGGADLGKTLDAVSKVVAEAVATAPETEARQVVLVTDLDSQTWSHITRMEVRRQISSLAKTATLSVFDVGQPAMTNLVIRDLRLAGAMATCDRATTVLATIRHTPGPLERGTGILPAKTGGIGILPVMSTLLPAAIRPAERSATLRGTGVLPVTSTLLPAAIRPAERSATLRGIGILPVMSTPLPAAIRPAERSATLRGTGTLLVKESNRPATGGAPGISGSREAEENGSSIVAELEMLVDGRRVARRTVSLSAGGETTVHVEHFFQKVGDVAVELRLAEDNLAVDNHRYLVVPVRETLRVLCVEGKRGAAANIALALDPRDTGIRNRVSVCSQRSLQEMDLNEFDTIFLCNLGRFDVDEARRLTDYCRHGGGLVVFLGDQVQPENYNRRLADLLPVDVGVESPEGLFSFDPRDDTHPLVAPFRGFEQAGLLTTPIWRYQRLASPIDTSRVALWFTSGDLAIVESPVDRGRIIVVATAGSLQSVDHRVAPPTPWNAWPTWPSFPPMVHELLLRAAERARPRSTLVGQFLRGNVPASVGALRTGIEEPSGSSQWLRVRLDGDVSCWDFGPAEQSGIYRVFEGANDSSPHLFAVNVDTGESQLHRISPRELPNLLHYEQSIQSLPVDDQRSHRRPLFRFLLGLVLAILACESVLAWHLGERAA